MMSLAETVGRNVSRLRKHKGWSQSDLQIALNDLGSNWSRATVGMLESKGVRAERLSDLALICAALECSVFDLVTGEAEVELRDKSIHSISWVRDALRGPSVEEASHARDGEPVFKRVLNFAEDEPQEAARIASSFGIDRTELRAAVRALSGQDSPTIYRDFLGRLDEEDSREMARQKRTLGTKKLRNYLSTWSDVGARPAPPDDRTTFEEWLRFTTERQPGERWKEPTNGEH